jgi:hypothetical protein
MRFGLTCENVSRIAEHDLSARLDDIAGVARIECERISRGGDG